MRIVTGGLTDSGCGTAGFRAFKNGWSCQYAVAEWKKKGRNTLWIRGAIRAYVEAGGKAPKTNNQPKLS